MSTDTGLAPQSSEAIPDPRESTADEVREAVEAAAAAATAVAALPPALRWGWLAAVADAIEAPDTAERLVEVADRETHLGRVRLSGELARCAAQLRFYGQVAAEGSYLGVTVDHARHLVPDLRRMRVPLGPVAVLGASNFPFAFGVLGNDTASALAAGCPVVVKAHPAHPLTSRMLARLAADALAQVDAPSGTFALVEGFSAGEAIVRAPAISAVAFTGSQRGGMALWQMARERDIVIPVYAEMGTVNPVVMTSSSVARLTQVADGFVGSFTLGSGQFCTKPGLLLAPAGHDVATAVGQALTRSAPANSMLTGAIAAAYEQGVGELRAAGAEVVSQAGATTDGHGVTATVLTVPADALRPGSRLLEECFGPVALVVEYADRTELASVIASLHGALAGSVITAGADDPETAELVSALTPLVGRVIVDDWPTGVAFSWAQQHGGPWPATTEPAATSVGAAALDRFTRPLTWQGVPSSALPPPLSEDNPWRVPRRVDGRIEYGGW